MRVRVMAISAVVVLAIVVMLVARGIGRPGGSHGQAHATPSVTDQGPVSVDVAPVRAGDLETRITASGSITSIRESWLASVASGRVSAVLVHEGDHVRAGQALIQLDSSELAADVQESDATVASARAKLSSLEHGSRPQEIQEAAAGVAQAQANLENAQANYERSRTLFTQGAVSKADLDAATMQLGVARASYDSARQQQSLTVTGPRPEDIAAARADLAQAEAAAAAARVRLQNTTIAAPFAGTITQRNVEPGQMLSSTSQPLLLAQIDDVYALLSVPEQFRTVVAPGQTARLAVDSLPGRLVEGRVEEVRPSVSADSRTFGVKVRISNSDGALRPGMFAHGDIVVTARPHVLQIPEQAVVITASGPIVFAVQDGHAVRRAVQTGAHQVGMVEVRTGLGAGDIVVVQGQEGLTDHQAVNPRPVRP